MAGEDLFDQRGARARHAENEDRSPRGIPGAGLFPQQLAGKRRLNAFEACECCRLVVADPRAFERVAFEQVSERTRMFAQVGVGLAEREMQCNLLFPA